MRVIVEIDGQEIEDPINLKELSIQLNFDSGDPTAQVSLNEWELGLGSRTSTRDGAKKANEHIALGVLGGVGIFEGLPFVIRIEDNNTSRVLFDGYLDLPNGTFECNKVTAAAIEQGGVDWLNEVADGFSFEYLATEPIFGGAGIIKPDDYILVPYIISTIPDARESVTMLVSLIFIGLHIKNSIQSLSDYIGGLTGNPLQFGNVISIIFRAAYILSLIIICIKMVKDLFNLIIQPVKYHAAMNVLLSCQKAASHLGMNFKSSILEGDYKDMVIMPIKFAQNVNTNKDGILGFLKKVKNDHNGFYKGTFGDLLRFLKTHFNAKIIVDGTDIRLERRDYSTSTALYQLPDVDQLEVGYNAEDFDSNYTIEYSVDQNDKNTINEYGGTEIQIQTLPVLVVNKRMVLAKGLNRNQMPVALGKRKTELTTPEKILLPFFKVLDVLIGAVSKVINPVIKVVNKVIKATNKLIKAINTIPGINIKVKLKPLKPFLPPVLANLIGNRIGMLKMENDFVSVPKVLMIGNNADAINNKLLATNETLLNAAYLWDNYHSINSFDGVKYAHNNQYVKRSIENVPLCFSDYDKLRLNNKIIDSNGVDIGNIDSLEWNPITEIATRIDFRINKVYTANLKTIKLIPNGQ